MKITQRIALSLQVSLLAGVAVLFSSSLRSQSLSVAPIGFDVASVKVNRSEPATAHFSITAGARLTAKQQTLKDLILEAFRIWSFQLSGGPKWLDSDSYDIEAKSEQPTSEDQALLKLQALLKERFHLTIHRETRELPVYFLAVGKNGPKLRPSQSTESPMAMAGAGTNNGKLMKKITGRNARMENLARAIPMMLGSENRPVLDKTGLTGSYDFVLWSDFARGGTVAQGNSMPEDGGQNVFVALQQQLGLTLESKKAPIEIIVIDRAEKPSEN